jgi:hypothetical protein
MGRKRSVELPFSLGAGRMASSAHTVEAANLATSPPATGSSVRPAASRPLRSQEPLRGNEAPLTTWFRAMYHLTQSKHGISSIELGRRLG